MNFSYHCLPNHRSALAKGVGGAPPFQGDQGLLLENTREYFAFLATNDGTIMNESLYALNQGTYPPLTGKNHYRLILEYILSSR